MERNRIVFIGDSITDCGRERPYGKRFLMGDGYVTLINGYLEMTHFKKGYRLINTGISGNTIEDLDKRWKQDVLDHKPEYVNVMIGINDVWRHFDYPHETDLHVSLEKYEQLLRKLAEKSIKEGIKVIFMSPFFIESNDDDKLKYLLRKYIQKMKGVAGELKLGWIDIQQEFDNYLQESGCSPMFLSADRIHPGIAGHMIISRAWIKYFEEHELK